MNVYCCRHASKAARGRPYAPVSGGPQQAHTYIDLLLDVFPMFNSLGPYLSCDPILMAKVLRVGKGFLKEVCQDPCHVCQSNDT